MPAWKTKWLRGAVVARVRSRRSAGRSGRPAAAPGAPRPRCHHSSISRLQPLGLARGQVVASRRSRGRGGTAPSCRPRTACPAGGRPPPSSRRATARGGRTSRNTAARRCGGADGIVQAGARSSRPRSASAPRPAIAAGGVDADQHRSRVGARSLAWQNWWRTSPRAAMPLRPGDHQRIADAAAMGVLLVAPQRRVRRPSPSHAGKLVCVSGPPMSSMRASFSAIGSGRKLYGPHRVDQAERPALLAGAVVRQHQHQRVVAAGRLAPGSRSAGRCAGRHGRASPAKAACSRVNTLLLVGADARPRPSTPSLRGGSPVSGGTMPIAFWRARRRSRSTSQPCANDGVVLRISSAGAWCGAWQAPSASQVSQGVSGRVGRVVGDEADGLVDQVGGQVIAVWRRCRAASTWVLSRTSSGAYWSVSASMKP